MADRWVDYANVRLGMRSRLQLAPARPSQRERGELVLILQPKETRQMLTTAEKHAVIASLRSYPAGVPSESWYREEGKCLPWPNSRSYAKEFG